MSLCKLEKSNEENAIEGDHKKVKPMRETQTEMIEKGNIACVCVRSNLPNFAFEKAGSKNLNTKRVHAKFSQNIYQ